MISLFLVYLYFRNIYGSCDGWELGIGNTQLQNLNEECIISLNSISKISIDLYTILK